MAIKFGYVNLLELGAVTVTSEQSGYPKHRLYDRLINRNWMATAASDQTVHVDQGASGSQPIDALFIPQGHTLDGATLYWEHSPDDTNWTPALSWTQTSDGAIFKTLSSAVTKRYWRLRIVGPTSVPAMAECFMTELKEIASSGPENVVTSKRVNVARAESTGGVAHYLARGGLRGAWQFDLNNMESSEYQIVRRDGGRTADHPQGRPLQEHQDHACGGAVRWPFRTLPRNKGLSSEEKRYCIFWIGSFRTPSPCT